VRSEEQGGVAEMVLEVVEWDGEKGRKTRKTGPHLYG